MARRRVLLSFCAAGIALCTGAAPAGAGVAARRSHVVSSGDSLWKIARSYECEVADLRRANRLDGNVIHAGQRLRIRPPCKARTAAKKVARRDEERRHRDEHREAGDRRDEASDHRDEDMVTSREEDIVASRDEDIAASRDADFAGGGGSLGVPEEVIIGDDGDFHLRGEVGKRREEEIGIRDEVAPRADEPTRMSEVIAPPETARKHIDMGRRDVDTTEIGREMVPIAVPLEGQSFGRPQHGYLVSGKHMPRNPAAYYLRRPERAWGTNHMVAQIVRSIHLVRRRFPRVHPLAIGDLSSRHGGRLTMHGSHQSGRDADIGFYFRRPQRGYPKAFVVATPDNLDFPATWALISSLCKTADQPLGVERIYMTYSTQAMFHRLARKHGVPRAQLDEWFQYPHGRRANHGIIRNEPGHEEHIHVRFRCAPTDPECE